MFYRVVEEGLSVGGPTLRYMDVRFGMNHHSLKQERVMFCGAVKEGLSVGGHTLRYMGCPVR